VSKIETGGLAFPATEQHGCNSGWPGMTLRDYFAAKAMQSMCEEVIRYDDFKSCAKNAYQMADAMLEARK